MTFFGNAVQSLSERTSRNVIVDKKSELSIDRQCQLLDISRATFYYKPKPMPPGELAMREKIMARLDYWHGELPSNGTRKLRHLLREEGLQVGRKRIKTLMDEMGIYAIHPKPNLSKRGKNHKTYPYLLRNKNIFLPNQVWAIDITYIKMRHGHMYLTAILDWHSRYIVGWELSDTLDTAPVLRAVLRAIEEHGTPAIINSDQGSQFTSEDYTTFLAKNGISQSMDGKARWVDNVRIERWFRSLKHEDIYLQDYETPRQLQAGLRAYIHSYNHLRPHQSLDYTCPAKVYSGSFAA